MRPFTLLIPGLLLMTALMTLTPRAGDEDFWDRNRRALTGLVAVAAVGAAVLALGSKERMERR